MELPKPVRASMLLVDDEPDIVTSLRRAITKKLPTVEVETASNGAEGLEVLRRRKVDLIVTDFRMPGMNGLDFLREARTIHPETPSIMISAYPTPDLVALAAGDQGAARLFIAKPFDLDYFIELLDGILFGRT